MQVSLSPESIESKEFSSTLRGYDRDEVDAYLRALADDLRRFKEGSSERLYENLGEEMGGLLQHARDSADEMLRQAEEDAARVRQQAQSEAQTMKAHAESQASEMRAAAEAGARETRAEASRDADETRAAAEADAKRRTDEATEKVRGLEREEIEALDRLRELREVIESVAERLRNLERGSGATEGVSETVEPGQTGARPEDSGDVIRLEPSANRPMR
jgi:DivIVA domain-containing protein